MKHDCVDKLRFCKHLQKHIGTSKKQQHSECYKLYEL